MKLEIEMHRSGYVWLLNENEIYYMLNFQEIVVLVLLNETFETYC